MLVYKWMWDETSLRLQLNAAQMEALFSPSFMAVVREVGTARPSLKPKLKFPGHTVQSFQQAAFFSGSGRFGFHVLPPGCLIPSTSTRSIAGGLLYSSRFNDLEHLKEAASSCRSFVFYMIPDGLAANRCFMAWVAKEVEECAPFEAWCTAHHLMVCWRDAADPLRLVSGFYCITQLLANNGTSMKINKICETMAANAPIRIGAAPPDHGYNDFVLSRTVRRAELTGSFFRDVGGPAYDPAAHAALSRDLDLKCDTIKSGITVQFFMDLAHHCCGTGLGGRCCSTSDEARSKLREAVNVICRESIDNLQRVAENKWQSVSKAATFISLGSLCCDLLPSAFNQSLTSPSNMRKVQADLQKYEADILAGRQPDEEGRDSADAFKILRGRRTVAAARLFNDTFRKYQQLAIVELSLTVDKLFSTIYDAEETALKHGGSRFLRPERIGFLQAMVDTGHDAMLFKVQRGFCAPILQPGNELHRHICCLVEVDELCDDQRGQVCGEVRALALRFSASFCYRFVMLFHGEWRYRLIRLLDLGDPAGSALFEEFKAEDCECCKGLFLRRLEASWAREPVLSEAEQRQNLREVYLSICEDAYVSAMHNIECLHADSRQALSRCIDRSKRLPQSVAAVQTLQRWRDCHRSTLGSSFMDSSQYSVRNEIKQNTSKPQACGNVRSLCAANIHFKERMQTRNEDEVDLTHAEHMKKIHSEWRNMCADARAPYIQQADTEQSNRPLHGNGLSDDFHPDDLLTCSPCQAGSSRFPIASRTVVECADVMGDPELKSLRGLHDTCCATAMCGQVAGNKVHASGSEKRSYRTSITSQ